MMRALFFVAALVISSAVIAQPMPHGMVYGSKPSRTGLMLATNLEKNMGKRTRISTSISGRVTQVTKMQGGWFDMDAGHGQIITAHFKNYKVNIPKNLKNHYIIMEGVAQKQFIADDRQHYAGANDSRKLAVKPNPKQLLTFEVKGLMVTK